jgi:hypothetical protein
MEMGLPMTQSRAPKRTLAKSDARPWIVMEIEEGREGTNLK